MSGTRTAKRAAPFLQRLVAAVLGGYLAPAPLASGMGSWAWLGIVALASLLVLVTLGGGGGVAGFSRWGGLLAGGGPELESRASLFAGQARPVGVQFGQAGGPGGNMIVGRGRGLAEPAEKPQRLFRQRQAIGVARLLHLGPAPLVAGRLVAPQPVEEAMRAQRLQRPHHGVTRAPHLPHDRIKGRLKPAGAEIDQIDEELQYLDRHRSERADALALLALGQLVAFGGQKDLLHVLARRWPPYLAFGSALEMAAPANRRRAFLGRGREDQAKGPLSRSPQGVPALMGKGG